MMFLDERFVEIVNELGKMEQKRAQFIRQRDELQVIISAMTGRYTAVTEVISTCRQFATDVTIESLVLNPDTVKAANTL